MKVDLPPYTSFTDFALRYVAVDPLSVYLGVEAKEVTEEYAIVELVPEKKHLNGLNIVHGATLYALMDQAVAVASNSRGYLSVTCDGKINYLNAGKPGERLSAKAVAISIKKNLSLWDVKITNENGELIATGQSLAYHFDKLPELNERV